MFSQGGEGLRPPTREEKGDYGSGKITYGRRHCSSGNNIPACGIRRESRQRRDRKRRRRRGRRRRCLGLQRHRMEGGSIWMGGEMMWRHWRGLEKLVLHSWNLGQRIALGRLWDCTRRARCHTAGEKKSDTAVDGYERCTRRKAIYPSGPTACDYWSSAKFGRILALNRGIRVHTAILRCTRLISILGTTVLPE